MRNISDYLGLSWSNTLLQPTINRIPAQANTMYDDRQATGFIRHSTGSKWDRVLTEREQRLINRTLYDAKQVGYSWPVKIRDYPRMWFEHLMDRK